MKRSLSLRQLNKEIPGVDSPYSSLVPNLRRRSFRQFFQQQTAMHWLRSAWKDGQRSWRNIAITPIDPVVSANACLRYPQHALRSRPGGS